jgi:uncharacterized protein YcbK (DUF882 family)
MTKNFTLEGDLNKPGFELTAQVRANLFELATNLEVLRAHFNMPITVNSAYRSPKHNDLVGGSKNSQHLLGNAADIAIKGVPSGEVADAIEFLIEMGLMKEGGLGRYNTFTHYDIRGTKARWDFRTI